MESVTGELFSNEPITQLPITNLTLSQPSVHDTPDRYLLAYGEDRPRAGSTT